MTIWLGDSVEIVLAAVDGGANRHGQVRRALTGMGHPVSADAVKAELVKLGFSRQHNRKTDEGSRHPDPNAQFAYINAKAETAQAFHLCPRGTRSVALAH